MENIQHWNEVKQALIAARQQLPAGDTCAAPQREISGRVNGTLQEYEQFLDNNELELAFDALLEVGERYGAGPAFWKCLAQAAALMQLHNKEKHALAKAGVEKHVV